MPELTSEQKAVKAMRNGFRVICANAGTGKTFSLCELFLELYLEEERRLYPGATEHVGGAQQLFILKQFLVVTFTVAAAHELNVRILNRFKELGIPEPDKDRRGNSYRICRTLDSFVQSWFMKPLIFERWMDADPDAQRSIGATLSAIPAEARQELERLDAPSIEYAFYRKWSWLTGDAVDAVILDSILRERFGLPPIPGVTPMSEWGAEWKTYIGALRPPANPDERWGQDFWTQKLTAFRAYYHQMHQLHSQWRSGQLANHPDAEKHVSDLAVWEQVYSARRDFSSIYEIARAKGYHPVRGFDNLAKMSILNEIAAAQHISDFREVHEISLRYYATKVRHHLMDHGDFLNTFVDILDRNPSLLEKDKEYPRRGIRAKYLIYDEAQDNSPYQNKIIYLLKPNHGVPTLCVVCGDAKQAIYGFRGACSYGFASMLEKATSKDKSHVLSLTCSFRSAQLVTALGNTIASTLPRYAKNVFDSTTIYKDPGKIVVAPPMKLPADEAAWALEQASGILETTTKDSVMFIHRNNFDEHPILPGIKVLQERFGESRVRYMTIHRSKGLEADHVFCLGATATVLPDPRGNETQEINLFYVACTRPRKTLFICCPYQKKKVDELGRTSWETVGPSPFIWRVPMLDDAADRAGWPMELREQGDSSHKRAVGMFLENMRKKESSLKRQWREMFPDIPLRVDPDDEPNDEVGGSPVPEEIRNLQKRSLYTDDGKPVDEAAFRTDQAIKDRVFRRLSESFFKNGDVPRLAKREFAIALAAGWILKSPEGNRMRFTPGFIAKARR